MTKLFQSALYITRDVNFDSWMPSDEDYNRLGKWLTSYKLSSNYNVLSRMIFSKLNWSCHDLLPWHRQSSLALFVIQSFHTFAPDCIAGNFLQDGVRQVSNIANKLRRTPEQVFTSWAWEMCSRLRLHRNDDTSDQLKMVDLDLEAEHLGEAVAMKNPLASYIALQMCQTGNVAEDFIERGLGQLKLVIESSHVDHVLECICHIAPLFLHRHELLLQSADFLKVIADIVSVDQTFLKMAKNLVMSDFPGPVLKEMTNMIAYQAWQYSRYGLHSSTPIYELWLRLLSEIQGWPSNRGILYIMDYCIMTSMTPNAVASGGTEMVRKVFKDLDSKLLDSNHEGFFSWLSGSKSATSYYNGTLAEFPWVTYFVLESEEEREESQLFWNCLVEELTRDQGHLDQCQKRIVTEKSFPDFASNINGLPICE